MKHNTETSAGRTHNEDTNQSNNAPVSQTMIESFTYKSVEAWRQPNARFVALQQYELDVAFTALAKARAVNREARRTQLLHAAILIDTLGEQMSLFDKLPHKGDVHTFCNDSTLDELTLQLEESYHRHKMVITRTKRTVDQICEILDHYPEQCNTSEKTDEYLREYRAVKRRCRRQDSRQQAVVPSIPQARQQPTPQQQAVAIQKSTTSSAYQSEKENMTPKKADEDNLESDQEFSA